MRFLQSCLVNIKFFPNWSQAVILVSKLNKEVNHFATNSVFMSLFINIPIGALAGKLPDAVLATDIQ